MAGVDWEAVDAAAARVHALRHDKAAALALSRASWQVRLARTAEADEADGLDASGMRDAFAEALAPLASPEEPLSRVVAAFAAGGGARGAASEYAATLRSCAAALIEGPVACARARGLASLASFGEREAAACLSAADVLGF